MRRFGKCVALLVLSAVFLGGCVGDGEPTGGERGLASGTWQVDRVNPAGTAALIHVTSYDESTRELWAVYDPPGPTPPAPVLAAQQGETFKLTYRGPATVPLFLQDVGHEYGIDWAIFEGTASWHQWE